MKQINVPTIICSQLHEINRLTAENTGKVIDIQIAARHLHEFIKIMNGMAVNESNESESWFYAMKAIKAQEFIEAFEKKSLSIQSDSIALDRSANELKSELRKSAY